MTTETMSLGTDSFVGTDTPDTYQVGGNIERLQAGDRVDGRGGEDILQFLSTSVSFDSSRMAGFTSVEILDVTAATGGLSVKIGAAAVAQATGQVLTLRFAGNAMTLDASSIGAAGTLLLDGDGTVSLRDLEGQVVAVGNLKAGTVAGGQGSDRIIGGELDDRLSGGLGSDTLLGGGGADTLSGEAGNDLLDGGTGHDALDGGAGHDLLTGGQGQDNLTGGAGSDTFRITGGGTVRIADFAPGDTMERIDLRPLGVAGFDDLALTDTPAGLSVTAAGLSLLLAGVTRAQLAARHFVFAGDTVQTMAAGLSTPFIARLTNGADTLAGTGAADVFELPGSIESLSGADRINGGGGTDTLRLLSPTVSLDSSRLAGLSSVERIDLASASAGLSVALNGAAVGQADDDRLTLFHGGNAMLLDVAAVGNAGTVVVEGTGTVTLRNGMGQAVSLGDAYGGTVQGGEGNDHITGGAGHDRLSGGEGSDGLSGGAGQDMLAGEAGNDRLDGGAGDDSLSGGAGHDLLIGGQGGDLLAGGAGSDTFRIINSGATRLADFTAADDMERIDLRALEIAGFAALTLTDTEAGLHVAGAGLSLLLAGVTAAQVSAGSFIFAGDPVQSMAEGLTIQPVARLTAAIDSLTGTAGADVFELPGSIEALTAADRLQGGAGADTLRLLSANVSLDGGRLAGLASIERIDVASAEVGLSVSLNAASLAQAADHRLTIFHGGNDMLLDVARVDGAGTVVVEGTGTVTLRNLDGQAVTVSDAYGGHVEGGSGTDVITGGARADLLSGGDHEDHLLGGGGDDLLLGGGEDDRLEGGEGRDTLRGGDDEDTLLGDEGADQLFGEAGDDVLLGGAGRDLLDGGEGRDRLTADAGQDVLTGGAGGDSFVLTAAGDGAHVTDFAAGSLLERIDLRGLAGVTGLADIRLTDTEGGVLLQAGGVSMVLEGVTAAGINAGQFLFAGDDAHVFKVPAGTAQSALQALIDGAPAGAVIELGAGVFILSSTLTVERGDLTIRGAGSDQTRFIATMAGEDAAAAIDVSSHDVRTYRTDLAVAAEAGATQIEVTDPASFRVGQIIYIGENNTTEWLLAHGNADLVIPQDAIDRPDEFALREQLVEIVAIEGNRITLKQPLPYSFGPGSAKVYQSEMIEHLSIGGFTVQTTLGTANPNNFNNDMPEWNGVATIEFGELAHSTVSDITVLDSGSQAIRFNRTYEVAGDRLTTIGSHSKGEDGNGYGLYLRESFANTLTDVTVLDTRHAVLFSSWSAEHYNTIHVLETNRDINFHGSPDSHNTIVVDHMVQSYGSSPIQWTAVQGGAYTLHPMWTIEANDVRFGHVEGSVLGDTVHALQAGALLSGMGGDDTLIGDAGDDVLIGGAGNDSLTGGGGNNRFLRQLGADSDIITDFRAGAGGDVLVLRGYAIQSFAGLFVTQDGADTLIDFGQDGILRLRNVQTASLTAANVEFLAPGQAQTTTGTPEAHFLLGGDGDDTIVLGRSVLEAGLAVYGGTGFDTVQANVGNYTGSSTLFGVYHSIERLDFSSATSVTLTVTEDFLRQADGGVLTLRFGDTATVTLGSATPAEGLRLVVDTGALVQLANSMPQAVFAGDRIGARITGGASTDQITGGAKADQLNGGRGDDVLEGRGGADVLTGGEGTDTAGYALSGGGVVASLAGPAGNTGDAAGDSYVSIENLAGSGFADSLTGDAGGNALAGGGGDDRLDGGAGNDTLTGGAGNDTLIGGEGHDMAVYAGGRSRYSVVAQADGSTTVTDLRSDSPEGTDRLTGIEQLVFLVTEEIIGTSGDDALVGTAADDILRGLAGDDALDGRAGADTLHGGAGNDSYEVEDAGDRVIEEVGAGTDIVRSSVSYGLPDNVERLVLTGSADIDGTGNGLANTLTGNGGANRLAGGAGADTLQGGGGNDTYLVDDVADTVVEAAGGGIDTVQASVTYTLAAQVENLTLAGPDAINGVGNALANILLGNGADNILDGAAGADVLRGGAGNDTYVVVDAGDQVIEAADRGADTVRAAISYVLGANLENLQLLGTANLDGLGNGAGNIIVGNAGANTLDGKAGADRMAGGGGDDIYIVDNAGDLVEEAAGGGTDTVRSSISLTLGAHLERLELVGTGLTNGFGNAGDNVLIGNGANNYLDGAAGADEMQGGRGDDLYVVDNAGDLVVEGLDRGTDTVRTSVSFTLSANVEALQLTGTASLRGTGNALGNTLAGNAGDNRLDGGGGADLLQGGAGNDTYIVDQAGDVVVEKASAGHDTVEASITYTLGADVEDLTLIGEGRINGTGNALSNVILGNGNDNAIDGRGGSDSMAGGAGNDTYTVENVGDQVIETANAGYDVVLASVSYALSAHVERLELTGAGLINGFGNALDNSILGNGANNYIDGGAGADDMQGGRGNDVYIVDNAGDKVTEGAGRGTDTVRASVSYGLSANVENLTLTGSAGIDALGNELDNLLIGNAGNNRLNGGAGADMLQGGAGNDTYVVDQAGDAVTELVNAGFDTVEASLSYALGSNLEKLVLTGDKLINGFGNALSNVILGNGANNVIDGGAGGDEMQGGRGDDLYVVDHAGDLVIEGVDRGNDTVRASVSHVLAANVENLSLVGTASITGRGNDLANVLIGNLGDNRLDGGGGADTLQGGAGNDTYVVDHAGDTIREELDAGTDTVESAVTYRLGDHVEQLTLTGTGAINGFGNAQANTLLGNGMANYLDGGAGADIMKGGRGDDLYVVDNAADWVEELADRGYDTVRASISYTLTDHVEKLVLTGASSLNGNGNALDNLLLGTTGSNVLDGKAGADRMEGGAGDDIYFVDNAADTVAEGRDAGTDTVISSVSHTLGANVENLTLSGSASIAASGNAAANALTGNEGDNRLAGGGGADTLSGGAGADFFVFETNGGRDLVLDFQSEVDHLVLTGMNLTMEQLKFSTIDADGDALADDLLVDYSKGQFALRDLQAAGLNIQDLVF